MPLECPFPCLELAPPFVCPCAVGPPHGSCVFACRRITGFYPTSEMSTSTGKRSSETSPACCSEFSASARSPRHGASCCTQMCHLPDDDSQLGRCRQPTAAHLDRADSTHTAHLPTAICLPSCGRWSAPHEQDAACAPEGVHAGIPRESAQERQPSLEAHHPAATMRGAARQAGGYRCVCARAGHPCTCFVRVCLRKAKRA